MITSRLTENRGNTRVMKDGIYAFATVLCGIGFYFAIIGVLELPTACRARVRQAKDSPEQALTNYSAALDRRAALADAQQRIHRSFDVAEAEYAAGALSTLDLLTTEQSLVALDAAVASSDAELAQDQISVFKVLGGG